MCYQAFNMPKYSAAHIGVKIMGKTHSENTVSYFFSKTSLSLNVQSCSLFHIPDYLGHLVKILDTKHKPEYVFMLIHLSFWDKRTSWPGGRLTLSSVLNRHS